jgi:hypothetical protein
VKQLSLPGVKFTHVAYLNDRTLLAADNRAGTRVRLWDLVGEAAPQEVRWPQARAALQLFFPRAAPFLQRQGLCPEGELLPPAFSDDPNHVFAEGLLEDQRGVLASRNRFTCHFR